MATPAPQPDLIPTAPWPSSRGLHDLPTDAELMRRVALGDHDAFIVVYESHARAALSMALRTTRSREAAEEVVQEAFVKLWRDPESYNPARGSLRTFVQTIARNRGLDALRSQAVRSRRSTTDEGLEEKHEALERTDVEATRREDAALVRAAVGRLPQGQSLVIQLAFFAGLTHREIAAELGMPMGTVKARIRLGIDKLRGEIAA